MTPSAVIVCPDAMDVNTRRRQNAARKTPAVTGTTGGPRCP